jgi:hypothetical protein
MIPELFLNLDESRGLQWTVVLAGGVDKLDSHNLTLD